jgi:uncharacterized protein involved in exopolysaccharide biosynthesis
MLPSDHLRHRTEPANAGREGTEAKPSLLGAVNILLRHYRLVAGIALLVLLVVIGATLMTPRMYSANMSMTTNVRKTPTQGASLASQFGITLPTGDGSRSPQFYVDLVHSREILGPVADSTYDFVIDGDRKHENLVTLLGQRVKPALQRQEAIKLLNESIAASISTKTNVIALSVKSPSPTLSYQIALGILRELNTFNGNDRRMQAATERKFSEQVLLDAQKELRIAEERQEQFLQVNLDSRSAPRLSLAQDRLAREVLMRQQVYTSLAQAAQQARIDEVRDTPFLSIVERPEVPILPDSRGGLIKSIVALLGGLLLGVLAAFVRDYARRARAMPSADRDEFELLLKRIAAQLRHPFQSSGSRS